MDGLQITPHRGSTPVPSIFGGLQKQRTDSHEVSSHAISVFAVVHRRVDRAPVRIIGKRTGLGLLFTPRQTPAHTRLSTCRLRTHPRSLAHATHLTSAATRLSQASSWMRASVTRRPRIRSQTGSSFFCEVLSALALALATFCPKSSVRTEGLIGEHTVVSTSIAAEAAR